MKPAAFDYYAPRTIDDVMALLKRYGSDARLLAGGQTLLPMMNFRLAAPEVIMAPLRAWMMASMALPEPSP